MATAKSLRTTFFRTTNIPVPSVPDFALDRDGDYPVGLDYILLEKLSGQPMNWGQATTEQKFMPVCF